jgi:hypothetical protein
MTRRAKLPGLSLPKFDDPALQRWAQAVTERLEVREGSRGDALERAVLRGDLKVPPTSPQSADINADTLAEKLSKTSLFRSLFSDSGVTAQVKTLIGELRQELIRRIISESRARGAQITRTELKIQELEQTLFATRVELSAAINSLRANNASQLLIPDEPIDDTD